MKEKYETIVIDEEGSIGGIGSQLAIHELAKILPFGKTSAFITARAYDEKFRQRIKEYGPEQIRDYRGKVVVYFRKGDKFIKVAYEPGDSLEKLLGLEILAEIKCTKSDEFKDAIKEILTKGIESFERNSKDIAQQFFEREYEEC